MPQARSHPVRWALFLAVLDGGCIFLAFAIAVYWTQPAASPFFENLVGHSEYFGLLYLIWCVQAIDQRLFVSRRGDALVPQLFAFTKTVFISLTLTLFVLALLYKDALDRPFALLFSGLVLVLMLLFRTTLRLGIWGLRRRGYSYRRILMIGANERSAEVAEIILAQRHYGFQIMGFLDDDESRSRVLEQFRIPYLGPVDALERALVEQVVDVVYIALPIKSYHERIQSIAHLCEGVGVSVRLIADLFPLKIATSKLERLAEIPVLTMTTERDLQPQVAFKRATDLLLSSVLLVLLSPLLIFIAVLIKLDSRGPVFTFEERNTFRHDRTFRLIRFRTRHRVPNDNPPRLPFTRIGAFLFEYGLDQLPELFNIWAGQMTLGDPRVHLPEVMDTDHDLKPAASEFPR